MWTHLVIIICKCFLKYIYCFLKIFSFSFEFSKCTFTIHFVYKKLIPRGSRFLRTKYMVNARLLNSKLNRFKIVDNATKKNDPGYYFIKSTDLILQLNNSELYYFLRILV